MKISQLISGIVLIIGGFVLLVVALFNGFGGGSFVALIYGIPLLILGFFILFNKNEDKIEQIKRVKGGRK